MNKKKTKLLEKAEKQAAIDDREQDYRDLMSE